VLAASARQSRNGGAMKTKPQPATMPEPDLSSLIATPLADQVSLPRTESFSFSHRMKEFAGLNASETESLLFTIETSLKIDKRFQFFLWAQGSLQGFIPHETLFCAHGDIAHLSYGYESFSRRAIAPESLAELGEPIGGLTPRIAEKWLQGGCEPCLFTKEDWDFGRKGFGHVAAHGAKEMQGEFGSFFMFMNMPEPPSARETYLLELFMPYLHMALHRMLANEAAGSDKKAVPDALLSGRQIQVLQWVKDGKTNQEIGQILDISPLTVKNHVQKILRKLNVTNRAQAVGKGTATRMFSDAAGDRSGGAG
jgi:transcriptional regulator EpsA